jgi:acyl-CoA synthetase (AMP-forming)/AMP-acid ligase II
MVFSPYNEPVMKRIPAGEQPTNVCALPLYHIFAFTVNMMLGLRMGGKTIEIDARGYFKIVDRKKDMILVSGFNVYPNEVEEVASACPGVLECTAIGVPDEKTGETVKLVETQNKGDPWR